MALKRISSAAGLPTGILRLVDEIRSRRFRSVTTTAADLPRVISLRTDLLA